MDEFGIFSDEGLIEGNFYSREEAENAIKERYADEDEGALTVAEVCHDHPDQPKEGCEECATEEEENEETEEEDES